MQDDVAFTQVAYLENRCYEVLNLSIIDQNFEHEERFVQKITILADKDFGEVIIVRCEGVLIILQREVTT